MFYYGLSPRHEKAKQDTIRVIRGASAKLLHYSSPLLVYPMENKMSLVHHIVKWWGYGYADQDDKGLSERTQRHLMLKPKSKLM
jgi:hypothetical protein